MMITMPANLPPQYKEVERRYLEAKGHEEKLEALREMMALLSKHKGTDAGSPTAARPTAPTACARTRT